MMRKKHLPDEKELFKKFLKTKEGDALWEEWKEADEEEGLLDESISRQIIQSVTENTRKPKVWHMNMKLLAAACISVLMAGIGYFSFFNKQAEEKPLAIAKSKEIRTVKQENNGAENMRLLLPDHSEVLLHPQSSIVYDAVCLESTDTAGRSIFLTGSAFFKVAKNPRKPFTVHSGGLSTTALGTQFDVLKNNRNTTVKLYEGKVVVRASMPHKGWTKEVILLPGEMVSLNDGHAKKINNTPVLATMRKDSIAVLRIQAIPSLPLQCNNMLLAKVLKTLEQYYKVQIQYDEELLKDKYFSGEILPEKSPETILRIICNMQNLVVEKTDSGYLIHH